MKVLKATIILSLGILIHLGVLLPIAFSGIGEEELRQEQDTLALINEYEGRLGELQGEIYDLKENQAWLELKVNQIKELNKAVPSSLYRSLAYKQSRIAALEISEQEVADYLDAVKERLAAQEAREPAKLNPFQNDLKQDIADKGLLEWFKMMPREDGGLVLKTTLPILFSSGSAAVSKSYEPFLKEVAGFVKNHRARIIVDGYTDINPIKTKKYPSNFELGAIRAANIVHALVGFGADPSMFKLATTGEYRFPDVRPMTENKAMERYVNLTLMFE